MILRLLIVLLFCASCGGPAKPTLHLFTWSSFFNPEVIAIFEKRYNCRVVIDLFDSNESMYAKLKLGSSGYDLIVPSNYYLDILEKQKMIQPLEVARLPNLKNLDPRFFPEEESLRGVPFVVGFSGIGYRMDRLPDLEASWEVFSRSDLQGRMTMLNDAREALGAALKYLGYSINTVNPEEVAQAANVLIAWKENLAKFESEQYKDGIASREFLVVQGYSPDILKVQVEDEGIGFLYPIEGAIMSVDYLAIPLKASQAELAYAFINFMLEPEIAAQNMEYTLSLMPVKPAYGLLDISKQENRVFFPTSEELDKMETIQDPGEAIKFYIQAWDKVKAG